MRTKAPPCFVCARPMRHVYGTYAWKCHYCDVIEEHDEWVSRTETIPEAESEAFGRTVFIDHSEEHLPSPGLSSLISKPATWLPTEILPHV